MDKTLTVAVLGLLVNLVGLFVFSHGHHGHSHGGHGHSHGGGGKKKKDKKNKHKHGHSHGGDPFEVEESHHGHSHGDDHHGHSHGGHDDHHDEEGHEGHDENLWGVYLHVLGDTLGSVGVIISSLLISFFDWRIADPISSVCLALIILPSVFPLLKSSANILLQRVPDKLQKRLPPSIERVSFLLPHCFCAARLPFLQHNISFTLLSLHQFYPLFFIHIVFVESSCGSLY
jgi:zinc transporter 5/7